MKIAVLYGSVRSSRQGIKGAKFICNQVNNAGHEAILIDAMEADLPMLDKMYKEYKSGEAPENIATVANQLNEVDALIVVSAEYNHSIPPGLKNLLDHFQKEYQFKACGIVTYSAGPFGGVRAASHIRTIVGELGMASTPIMLPLSGVGKSFDDDGTALDEAYLRRAQRFLAEFLWFAEALSEKRKHGTPY